MSSSIFRVSWRCIPWARVLRFSLVPVTVALILIPLSHIFCSGSRLTSCTSVLSFSLVPTWHTGMRLLPFVIPLSIFSCSSILTSWTPFLRFSLLPKKDTILTILSALLPSCIVLCRLNVLVMCAIGGFYNHSFAPDPFVHPLLLLDSHITCPQAVLIWLYPAPVSTAM